jgi:hypothetical protein
MVTITPFTVIYSGSNDVLSGVSSNDVRKKMNRLVATLGRVTSDRPSRGFAKHSRRAKQQKRRAG